MLWFQKTPTPPLFLLASLVGVGGAFGAIVFHVFIFLSTAVFYGHTGETSFILRVEEMSVWQRLLIPTLGGLLVGLIYKIARVGEAEGEGVPEVMDALAHHKGVIRPIVAPIKIITAALTLGSGGSAGREGPVIQIGSTIGSTIANLFRQDTTSRKTLLGAGAAAGIAATFGAPLAGIVFVFEILKHKLTTKTVSVLVIAVSVSYGCTKMLFHSDGLRFPSDSIFLYNTTSLIAVGIVVLATSLTAAIFAIALPYGSNTAKRLPLPALSKPAIGGFLVGCIGLTLPFVHEPATYPLMITILSNESLSANLLLGLIGAKILATTLTLGSGGSGGVFAPLLLLGALVGTVVLKVATLYGVILPGTGLVIIGMAAMFAAAASAPLTAAIIVFEITQSLTLLPVLLLASYVSSVLVRIITKKSVYAVPND